MIYITNESTPDYNVTDNHVYFDISDNDKMPCIDFDDAILSAVSSITTYTHSKNHKFTNRLYSLLISLGHNIFIKRMYIGLNMSKDLALNIPKILLRVIKYCNNKSSKIIQYLLRYCSVIFKYLNNIVSRILRDNIEILSVIPNELEQFNSIRKTSPPITNF